MMMIPHELDEGRGLVFQSAGNPSRFSNDVLRPIDEKMLTAKALSRKPNPEANVRFPPKADSSSLFLS